MMLVKWRKWLGVASICYTARPYRLSKYSLPKTETKGRWNCQGSINRVDSVHNAGIISGDMTEYKAAAYGLRRTVKDAKRQYKDKIEADFSMGDPAQVWKGLRIMTDFKNKPY